MSLAVVLLVIVIVALVAQIDPRAPAPDQVRAPAAAYTPRAAIFINGDANFTAANGVVSGDGTALNPFIISNWDISATLADGIAIGNANSYFIVRDCTVHDGHRTFPPGSGNVGIYLHNCSHAQVMNNNCSRDEAGIQVEESPGVVLTSNVLFSNFYAGISVSTSQMAFMTDNNCSHGSYDGVVLSGSANSTLDHNRCYANGGAGIGLMGSGYVVTYNNCTLNGAQGIYLESSYHCLLSGNDLVSSGSKGIFISQSSDITVADNTCLNNIDYGVVLSMSGSNELSSNNCTGGANGIYLLRSDGNTITQNNCSDNGYGIVFDSTNNCSASDNTISLNGNSGVALYSSDNNILRLNRFYDNQQYAVLVNAASSSNTVHNNTFTGNNGSGGTYDPAKVQASDAGTDNAWNSTDGYGNYWSDWTSPDVAPPFGIVDEPYNISGGAGARDFFPLTTPSTPIPEFGPLSLGAVVAVAGMLLFAIMRGAKAKR